MRAQKYSRIEYQLQDKPVRPEGKNVDEPDVVFERLCVRNYL